MVADIAMFAFGKSAAGDALSESFEKVHMIIFAVMMVFIFQTRYSSGMQHFAEPNMACNCRTTQDSENRSCIRRETVSC